MFSTAILYGIVFTVSKPAIESSSTVFYSAASAVGLLIVYFFVCYFRNNRTLRFVKIRLLVRFFPLGLLDTFKILSFMQALSLSYVGIVDAANNTSAIYTAILGRTFLKEVIKNRLPGILIIILGVIILNIA